MPAASPPPPPPRFAPFLRPRNITFDPSLFPALRHGPPMPKRNLVLLFLIAVACLLAWAARERGGRTRLYGEVTGHVGRMALEPVDDEALFRGAMEGMFARLDEHSSFEAVDPRRGILPEEAA